MRLENLTLGSTFLTPSLPFLKTKFTSPQKQYLQNREFPKVKHSNTTNSGSARWKCKTSTANNIHH